MADPVDSRTCTNLITSTIDTYFDDVQDGFFLDSPLTSRLYERDNIRLDGGAYVRQPFIYAGLGGGSHATGSAYDTSLKEFFTYFRFPWTELYAPLTFDELEQTKNEGAAAVIDYAQLVANVAELTLKDTFSNQIYATSPGTNDLLSLFSALVAYNSGSVYANVTADTSAQGAVLAPNTTNRINTTGGPFSWDMLQNTFGACSLGAMIPDLVVTTQVIYNKMVVRSIAAYRTGNQDDVKKFGASGIRYNGADVVVDQKCPSGYIFILNTKFIKLVLHKMRSFIRRSRDYGFSGLGFPLYNDSQAVDQLVCFTQFVFNATRVSGYISNVT